MTDFVLETNKFGLYKYSHGSIRTYANFLKQPLTLGMFVPCDDDGNVLQQDCDVIIEECRDCSCREYEKAKSKVLFKNCCVDYNIQGDINVLFVNQLIWNTLRTNYLVEDLIPYNLDLAVSF